MLTGTPSGEAAPAEVPSDAARRRSVLIVDDDRWTTRAIEQVLGADPGLEVLDAVHGGEEAIAAYRRHRPDIVLMDLNMHPSMGGIDATAEIRRLDPEARVVLLTTVAPGPGIARALQAGAMAAVNKTASDETLRATVKAAANGDDPSLLKGLAADITLSGDLPPGTAVEPPRLTPTECSVLLRVCEGLGYAEIAEQQFISEWTVKSHVRKLREKLGAENLAQLVVRALQLHYFSG
ncbi:DNA-binding response regulator [Leucobacter zeae]|nr:DNA-binding response regulator [Leucobacter zeae]